MRNIIDTKHIVAGDFWGFLEEYDKYIAEGFERSDSNEFFPMAMPSLFTVTLVKYEYVAEKETVALLDTTPKEPSAKEIAKQELIEKLGEDQVGAAVIPEEPVVGKHRANRRK